VLDFEAVSWKRDSLEVQDISFPSAGEYGVSTISSGKGGEVNEMQFDAVLRIAQEDPLLPLDLSQTALVNSAMSIENPPL